MGPTAGLLPKYVQMCHSGHSDLIHTPALGNSSQLPTGHSDLDVGEKPNPKGHPHHMGPPVTGMDEERKLW